MRGVKRTQSHSGDEGSVVSGDEETEMPTPELEVHEPVRMAIRDAFQSMVVDLRSEFNRRACVMKTVLVFLKGPFRCALQTALDEICCGVNVSDPICQARGWKLLMLLPRMLLHRPPRGGFISKAKLAARFEDFSHGRWQKLIDAGRHCAEEASTAVSRKRRTNQHSDIERRAVRAQSLVQLGELCSFGTRFDLNSAGTLQSTAPPTPSKGTIVCRFVDISTSQCI